MLFAKQPIRGKAKTRLQPEYTAGQAAEISAALIRLTVELAVSRWPGEVYLYAWPSADHALFRDLAAEFRIHLAQQAQGHLGKKMRAALREGIRRRGAAAIMGCDVPHCRRDVIDEADHWMARGYDVLGPTEDGGYYFIGLHRAPHELFERIEWGAKDVAETTIARARKLGIEFKMLSVVRDVDSADDLWLAVQECEALRRFLEPPRPRHAPVARIGNKTARSGDAEAAARNADVDPVRLTRTALRRSRRKHGQPK